MELNVTEDQRVLLWDAISIYTQTCGGDTGVATVTVDRMNAVVGVETVLADILGQPPGTTAHFPSGYEATVVARAIKLLLGREFGQVTEELVCAGVYLAEVWRKRYPDLGPPCEHEWKPFDTDAKDGTAAICGKCGEFASGHWYCPDSPDHLCHYSVSNDECDHCGYPDERL